MGCIDRHRGREKERRGCVYLVDVGDAQAGEGVQQHLDIIRLELDRHTDRHRQ